MKQCLADAKKNDLLYSGLTTWIKSILSLKASVKSLSDLKNEHLIQLTHITSSKKQKQGNHQKPPFHR